LGGLEIAFLRAARESDSELVGIVMTEIGEMDSAGQAIEAKSLDNIVKLFKHDAVWAVIARALDVSQFRRENRNEQQAVGLWAPRSVIRVTLGFGSLLQEADYAAMRRLPVRIPFYCRRALWVARSPRCFSCFNELAIAQAPLPLSLTNVSGTSIAMQAGGEIDQNSKRQPKEPEPPGFTHFAR
jgi:hypothetical protein